MMHTVICTIGWFTVDFHGSVENPVTRQVTLSTAPDNGYTHWGQQVLFILCTAVAYCISIFTCANVAMYVL